MAVQEPFTAFSSILKQKHGNFHPFHPFLLQRCVSVTFYKEVEEAVGNLKTVSSSSPHTGQSESILVSQSQSLCDSLFKPNSNWCDSPLRAKEIALCPMTQFWFLHFNLLLTAFSYFMYVQQANRKINMNPHHALFSVFIFNK